MSHTQTISPETNYNRTDTIDHTPALPKGYIFNLLLFLIFVLPDWDLGSFQLGPVITDIREVSLVLLPIVYFFYPSQNKSSLRLATKYWILAFFILLVGTELVKKMHYGISLFDTIKNLRIGVPVFSGLLVLLQGKKVNPEFCLKTILVAIIISCVLTPLFVLLGIEPANFTLEDRQLQVQYLEQGRLINDNYEFGLIGIALLYLVPKVHTYKTGLKRLLLIASVFSLIIMVLFFNRTLLTATFLLGLILFFKNFSLKTLAYITGAVVLIAVIGGYFYQTNAEVREQVQDRILIVFQEEGGLAESVYYDNRDKLYAEYLDQLGDHWLLGIPGGDVLIDTGNVMSSKSDISFFNVWIRYGIVAEIVFIIIFIAVCLDHKKKLEYLPRGSLSYQIGRAVMLTIPLFVLVSFNVDVLVGHNAILFLLLFMNFFDVDREI